MTSNGTSIRNQMQWLNSSAQNISKVNSEGSAQVDLAKEMTDQINIEGGVKSNVAAIKTEDEMFKTLLDIKA